MGNPVRYSGPGIRFGIHTAEWVRYSGLGIRFGILTTERVRHSAGWNRIEAVASGIFR